MAHQVKRNNQRHVKLSVCRLPQDSAVSLVSFPSGTVHRRDQRDRHRRHHQERLREHDATRGHSLLNTRLTTDTHCIRGPSTIASSLHSHSALIAVLDVLITDAESAVCRYAELLQELHAALGKDGGQGALLQPLEAGGKGSHLKV